MAQTFDEIAEILEEMRVKSDLSNEGLRKALAEINLKLAVITDDEAIDMIKFYLSELKNLVTEKFNDSSIKLDNIENLFGKINYSENFEDIKNQLKQITDELSFQISSVPLNISFDEIEQKIDDCKSLTDNFRDEFHQNAQVSVENSQRLADGMGELSNKLNDVQLSFFENSGRNYENLKSLIENISLKTDELNSSISNLKSGSDDDEFGIKFENLEHSLRELSGNIDMLRDISLKKYQETIDNISNELNHILIENNQKLNSDNEINFGEIKTSLNNISSEFDGIKSEVLKANDSTAYNISAGFSNVNTIFENILAGVNSLGENFDNVSKQNAKSILSKIGDLSLNFEELKAEINQSAFADKIIASANSISSKLDELSEIADNKEDLSNIKNALAIIKTEADMAKEEYSRVFKENADIQSEQIKNVSENIDGLRDFVNGIGESLKNYIAEIENTRKQSNSQIEEKTVQKLLDLEAELAQNSQGFEAQFANLQSKLAEFVHIVEGSNSDTEGKILSSLEEVTGIKDELLSVHEVLKNLNLYQNEKFAETISLLDAGVENIVFNINNINDSLKNGVENSLKESIVSVEEKFVEISNVLNVLKSEISDTDENLISEVSDKITSLKDEISLINTDIADAVQCKADEILRTIEPLKISLESFNGIDVENLIKSFKAELESSFINFTSDLDKELESNAEVFSNITQTYKEIMNKISIVEEVVNKTLQNNIELLGISIETGLRNLNSGLDEKFENQSSELKAYLDIAVNDRSTQDLINDFRAQLIKTIESLTNYQQLHASKTEELSGNISILANNIKAESQNIIANCSNGEVKSLVQELKLDNTDVKEGLEEVDKKIETLSNVPDMLSALNVKVDVLAMDDEVKNLVDDLKFDNSDIKNGLNVVDKKLDNLEKLDKLDKLEDTQDLLSVLNVKIDTLVMDEEVKDLIDDLKSDNSGIKESLNVVDKKLDNLEKLDKLGELDKLSELEKLDNKLDKLENTPDMLSNLSVKLDEISSNNDVKSIVEELKLDNTDIKEGLDIVDKKIGNLESTSDLLSALNSKLDILASNESDENLLDEIDEIKSIIYEQRKYFEESSDEKSAALDKYLRDVLLKLENVDIEKSSEDIKESVLNAVLSLSDQISFVEETEEIKDFVEEKTDNINKNIIEVHKQLKYLTNGDNDFDYTYTLQDVESDIAKLRLAMNNISTGKFEDITDEINRIVMSVENLESSLTQDQIIDLKTDIEKLNEDILSLSSRTNKILLNSDESYRAVNEGLNNFSDLILKLEDRISFLDNTAQTERLEKKIDNIQSLSASSLNSLKVINQVMMYLGEWIDATTQDISGISDKIEDVPKISETIEKIKELLPDNSEIINELQRNFVHQEERIDNLERKLDKILSALEEKDDMLLNRKADKLEQMLSGLSANIEKLTSYVDEE